MYGVADVLMGRGKISRARLCFPLLFCLAAAADGGDEDSFGLEVCKRFLLVSEYFQFLV